jgi:hypothetical protein
MPLTMSPWMFPHPSFATDLTVLSCATLPTKGEGNPTRAQ